ncbi:unannotated protein [freshwater metagenome]|uniref:Unannotated protein n=1 Tax=freshwater metagenome TaxID=449393 RepID=A0A6J7JYA8_9ZZZZ
MEDLLQFGQLVGMDGGEIDSLREILSDVVELPSLLFAVEVVTGESDPRQTAVEARGHPALVIDRPIAEDLEVLRRARARRGCIGKRVVHRGPMHLHLLDAVHMCRQVDASGCVDRWCDVDEVMELRAKFADTRDVTGPRKRHGVAGTAEMRGDLLHPLERCIERPGPTHVEVVLATGGSEIIDVFE